MIKIAIASGKGGTGKTTVSVNLYYFLSKKFNNQVRLVDCDVEEPNDILFFPHPITKQKTQVFSLIPEIDTKRCTFCKKCSDWCEFNAITVIKNLKFAEVNKDLCHSCGACVAACEFGSISEKQQPLGLISTFDTAFGNGVIEGRLEIGSAMQTSLIKEVKKYAAHESEITIFDAPPGTSCPVVETVSDADYVILVTEPTPFGLHDLKITIDLLFDLKIPFGVVVNKAGLGNNEIYHFLKNKNIELLGKIPYLKEYAAKYSNGRLLENIPVEMERVYIEIIEKLESEVFVQ